MKKVMSLLAVLVLGLGACGTEPAEEPLPGSSEYDMQILEDDYRVAEHLMESVELGQIEAAIAIFTMDGFETGMTPEEMASHAEQAFGSHCHPTCLAARAYYDTLTVSFNDCSCDFGLQDITGTLTVAYRETEDLFYARIQAPNFLVSGAVTEIKAWARVYRGFGANELDVKSRSVGTGSRGLDITTRVGHYDLTWDDRNLRCLTMDGHWGTNAYHSLPFMTTISGMKHCGWYCPEMGGQANFRCSDFISLRVYFGDSDTVDWVSSKGTTGKIVLPCY